MFVFMYGGSADLGGFSEKTKTELVKIYYLPPIPLNLRFPTISGTAHLPHTIQAS